MLDKLILDKYKDDEFEELLTTCHDSVRALYGDHITDDYILSYSTNDSIVFLSKEKIISLLVGFLLSSIKSKQGLESRVWKNEYSDAFLKYVCEYATPLKTEESRYFSHLMDCAYEVYSSSPTHLIVMKNSDGEEANIYMREPNKTLLQALISYDMENLQSRIELECNCFKLYSRLSGVTKCTCDDYRSDYKIWSIGYM